MEDGVAADGHGRVDVRRRRIDDGDPGGHERVERARAQEPLERRELPAVVDAGDLARIRARARPRSGSRAAPAGRSRPSGTPRPARWRARAGRRPRAPATGGAGRSSRSPSCTRGRAARPASHRAPRRWRGHGHPGRAESARSRSGSARHERQEGGRRARRPVAREERGEGGPVEQRHVPVEEQEFGGGRRHLGPRPAEGVSRAPGLRLLHEARPEVGECRSDGRGTGGHDDHRPRDAGLPHEGDRIADQRLSAQQVEDLGPARPHALALARGEDHGPRLARDRPARGTALPSRSRHGPPPAAGRGRHAG